MVLCGTAGAFLVKGVGFRVLHGRDEESRLSNYLL